MCSYVDDITLYYHYQKLRICKTLHMNDTMPYQKYLNIILEKPLQA